MKRDKQISRSRSWLIALPTIVLVALGLLWSGFWYYASVTAEASMTAWRAREADAGRRYGCTEASFGGYPFRIEVSCRDPAVEDRGTGLAIRAGNLAAVAQVWDPTLVVGEISGPMTLAPLGGTPTAQIDWKLAQASLRGVPGKPERLSVVLDKPSLASSPPVASGPLVDAEHAEFHARFAPDSSPGHPVLDLALNLTRFEAPAANALGPPLATLTASPTDAAVVAVLRGLSDLEPRPLAQQLRAIEAAKGRLEIVSARLQQGNIVANATGNLALTPGGTLTGELNLTIVNFAKLVPLLGIDRMVAQAAPPERVARFAPTLDRIMPGLGNILRDGNAGKAPNGSAPSTPNVTINASAAALGAALLGGRETEFEGQRAISLVLRFDDGTVSIGPLKFGRIAPLF